jgi:hypothetical protein
VDAYLARRSTCPELAPWAAHTTAHIFVDFHKYAERVDGSKRNSTHPKGTSGGPVFYLGDFNDPDTFRYERKFQPMLEGIVVERSEARCTLIAVKISAIEWALQAAGMLPRSE